MRANELLRRATPSLGPVHGVKCRYCRTIFDRPTELAPDLPATACSSPACQAARQGREEELARRALSRIQPQTEILRPNALN